MTFAAPTLGWFQPFGANLGAIYPKHFWDGKDTAQVNAAFARKPIGTGTYVVETLSRAAIKANLGDKGKIYGPPGTGVEKIQFNFSDPNKAKQILEDAGWKLNGDVREKDGVRLVLRYVTTVNGQRQKVQAVVKQNLKEVGFEVNDSVFFDSSPGNERNFTHFYADMQEYTDGTTSAFPLNYMKYWYAGPNGANIAQEENQWTGTNKVRYRNPDYDAAWEKIASVTEQAAVKLFVQLNDIVIDEAVEVPLVQVVADLHAVPKRSGRRTSPSMPSAIPSGTSPTGPRRRSAYPLFSLSGVGEGA